MLNMIAHKCRDGEITMVMPLIIPDLHPLLQSRFFGRSSEILWEQLTLLVKVIRRAYINKYVQRTLVRFNQFCSVMVFPFRLIIPKVTFECFLTPWAVDGVRDGGEG